MKIPVPELVVASLIALAIISTESGSIAGVISTSVKTGEQLTGSWASYSPTRFGARTVEFFANGTCQFRAGVNEAFPCKWRETENGRAQIDAAVSGRDELFSASIAGDYLVVMEPGREITYVRTNTKAAYARQQMVRGPATFTIPWTIEPDQQ
jgi:hypothetical protein